MTEFNELVDALGLLTSRYPGLTGSEFQRACGVAAHGYYPVSELDTYEILTGDALAMRESFLAAMADYANQVSAH